MEAPTFDPPHLDKWTILVRRYLVDQDSKWIVLAIESVGQSLKAVKNRSFLQYLFDDSPTLNSIILEILEYWHDERFNIVVRKIRIGNEYCIKKGQKDEALTLCLLVNELVIRAVEGNLDDKNILSGVSLVDPFTTCSQCIDIALELGDLPLAASYYLRQGNGLYSIKEYNRAIRSYEDALSVWATLSDNNPNQYLPFLAKTMRHLGDIYKGAYNKLNIAQSYYESAYKIWQSLSLQESDFNLSEMARTVNNLGLLYAFFNRKADAENFISDSITIYKKLIELQGNNKRYWLLNIEQELAIALCNLGSDMSEEPERANIIYEEAKRVSEKLILKDVENGELCLALSLNGIGKSLLEISTNNKDKMIIIHARKALETALEIYKKYPFIESDWTLSKRKVFTLKFLALILSRHDMGQANQRLEEAIAICEKHNELGTLYSSILSTQAGIYAEFSNDPLGGFIYDEKAVLNLESVLKRNTVGEEANRYLFKKEIEISYSVCIAVYTKHQDHEKVFHLIESLHKAEQLSELTSQTIPKTDILTLTEAKKIMVEQDSTYLSIQVIPEGLSFFAITREGKAICLSSEKGFRKRFFELFDAMDKSTFRQRGIGFDQESNENVGKELDTIGKDLFQLLPQEIQDLLFSKAKNIFLCPYADLQNLPFELLYSPDYGWLGLKHSLPRVHSFSELKSIIKRQPNLQKPTGFIVGDSRIDLPYAAKSIGRLSKLLEKSELNFAKYSLLGDEATSQNFKNCYNSKLTLFAFFGHGGSDKMQGGFLCLANKSRLWSYEIQDISLNNMPVIHLDCCYAGEVKYIGGGQQHGFGYFAINAGASCCLLANRPIFDEQAFELSESLYVNLLEKKMAIGEALIQSRNFIHQKYNYPLYWTFPVLFGNPNGRL